jgi:hypothetical protein
MFLGLPDPDPLVRCAGRVSATNPFFSHKCVGRTEIMLAKLNFNTQF